jgi:predicted nucleic acid-binding protein
MSDRPAYQFVDTNVLVYAHDASAGLKHERALALTESLWETRTGCLSIQVLEEFYVTVTRKVARPLASEAAAQIVADLAAWRVHTPEVADVLAAVEIHRRYGISFWDGLVIQSAVRLGCQSIWSEDLNPSKIYAGIPVLNPLTLDTAPSPQRSSSSAAGPGRAG